MVLLMNRLFEPFCLFEAPLREFCNTLPSVFDANAWDPICFMEIHFQLNSANGYRIYFIRFKKIRGKAWSLVP